MQEEKYMKNEEKKTGKYPCVFRFRTDEETAKQITEDAEMSGLSVGRYLRHRITGRKIPAKYDLQLLNEIRRQGGLLKHLATHGVDTEEALQVVIQTMQKVQKNI